MNFGTRTTLSCLLLFVSAVVGQTTHTVTVGKLGSFYDPPTLSAGLNDTVVFVFSGPVHTVTQTTLNTPCLPLPGGFSSGPSGIGLNPPFNVAPTWTLKITNISEPIWFFCEISAPVSHCASGMVGAINPPSQQVYNQFKASAQAVSGTPSPVATVALTGSGAFATASPSVPASSTSFSSSSTSAPSAPSSPSATDATTPTPSEPSVAQSGTKSHLGAIIGGVVGGLVGGLLILAALLWCLRHRKSKQRRESASTYDSQFFRYNVPVRTPSDAFRAAKASEASSQAPPQMNEHTDPILRPLSPLRRGQVASPQPINFAKPLPGLGAPQAGAAFSDSTYPTSTNITGAAVPGQNSNVDNIDMQVLANEVAQVLIRSTSGNTLNGQRRADERLQHPQGMRVVNSTGHLPSVNSHLEPPAYRRQAGMNSPAALKASLPRD